MKSLDSGDDVNDMPFQDWGRSEEREPVMSEMIWCYSDASTDIVGIGVGVGEGNRITAIFGEGFGCTPLILEKNSKR